jgi:bifunctional DNA-binding transcriptional regulator/antitoxin component of YhaV-PrlF toxin-antitoxin module
MADTSRSFDAVVTVGPKGRVMVPLPFAPDDVWGTKPDHHVAGTIGTHRIRAVVEPLGDGYGIVLGSAWRRDCGVAEGDVVSIVLSPEGPQRDDLPADFRVALEANPDAGAYFDGIAQFYRNAYLRYIEATKRRPDVRVERIDEVVSLLAANKKQRPS